MAQKPKDITFNVKPKTEDQRCRSKYSSLVQMLGDLRRRNPPCNGEDNLRAGHVVIEDRFGGY